MEVKQIIAEIKEKMDQRGGLKHMYFVACGGSKAAIFPGLYLIQSEAKNFSATTYTSNEFVHRIEVVGSKEQSVLKVSSEPLYILRDGVH